MLVQGYLASSSLLLANALIGKQLLVWLSSTAALVWGSIELVERRNRSLPLHPARQIAISTLLESMPEAVFLIDATGRIIEVNQAAERFTGFTRAQVLQMSQAELAKYVSDHDSAPS